MRNLISTRLILVIILSSLIVLILTPIAIATAEIWKCKERFISKEIKPGPHCQAISASVLCGSDGNKYITRTNPDYLVVSEYCKFSENSKNIFASNSNLGRAESTKENRTALESYFKGSEQLKNKNLKAKENKQVPNLAGKGPHEILTELFKNPQSINELAKLVFPSLQEDFSD